MTYLPGLPSLVLGFGSTPGGGATTNYMHTVYAAHVSRFEKFQNTQVRIYYKKNIQNTKDKFLLTTPHSPKSSHRHNTASRLGKKPFHTSVII